MKFKNAKDGFRELTHVDYCGDTLIVSLLKDEDGTRVYFDTKIGGGESSASVSVGPKRALKIAHAIIEELSPDTMIVL